MVQLFTYADVAGDYWLGSRVFTKGSGWGPIQPILGPMAQAGLQFAYFDTTGAATVNRNMVARVGIQAIGRSAQAVRRVSGSMEHVVDTLTTHAALRNNRRQ